MTIRYISTPVGGLKIMSGICLMSGTWSALYGYELHTHENPAFHLATQSVAYS